MYKTHDFRKQGPSGYWENSETCRHCGISSAGKISKECVKKEISAQTSSQYSTGSSLPSPDRAKTITKNRKCFWSALSHEIAAVIFAWIGVRRWRSAYSEDISTVFQQSAAIADAQIYFIIAGFLFIAGTLYGIAGVFYNRQESS